MKPKDLAETRNVSANAACERISTNEWWVYEAEIYSTSVAPNAHNAWFYSTSTCFGNIDNNSVGHVYNMYVDRNIK